jgi:hypothetical protein
MKGHRHGYRWLIGTAGIVVGALLLFYFPAHPVLSGVIALIVVKHLGLVLLVGSPMAALFSRHLETLRGLCPFRRGGAS